MPKFLLNRWHGRHIIWLFSVMLALTVCMFVYQWIIGVIALAVCGGLAYYTLTAERAFRRQMNDYVLTLSYRIKKAGNELLNEMPIGIVLYNEDQTVEWHNPYVSALVGIDNAVGHKLAELVPALKNRKEKDGQFEIVHDKHVLQLMMKSEERLLYITDITAHTELEKRYEEEKMAVGIVMLDNVEEATQGMDDQARSVSIAKVTTEITKWAQKHQMLLRRMAADRFMIFFNHRTLRILEQTRFEILDDIRDMAIEQKLPFTLSIGVAAGSDSLIELGQLAQRSLDMTLGRGGDQAAVKVGQRLSFYGGRSNAVEKRTRVRARVISHALRDLIRDCENVIIMGHRYPDMDSIGAAIGVLKAAQVMKKEGYIVLEGVNPSIRQLMDQVAEHKRLSKWFITPEQALQVLNPRSLAVVVDTHKASMVAEPKLLQLSGRIVIVDHHRRGEQFINEATLVYMEPYASSTCELVTELLQYFHDQLKMDVLEATALLAGIVVDTKSFALHTGARTFEAASFLRRNGADSALIQHMLKEDLQEYVKKAEIVKRADILYGHIAISVTEKNRKYSQLLIAQVADTLVNMNDIYASFVICERPDGLIGISARSVGNINVQVIMERLGGGGHLTHAAAQLEGTLEEARKQLLDLLNQMESEEGLFQ